MNITGENLNKLTNDDAEFVRWRYAQGGIRQADLAAEFRVSESTIQHIITGRHYARRQEPTLPDWPTTRQPPVREERWLTDAACKGMGPSQFFPTQGEETRSAKAVCAACPVKAECLEYALERREDCGIWGGTSERERRRMRARRRQDALRARLVA